MSTTWFPPGWILDVDNPGFGQLAIYAPAYPLTEPAVVTQDWAFTLYGPHIGAFLDAMLPKAAAGDLAVAWGLNRMTLDGTENWSRGTRVFARRDVRWQMIHQHVSFPLA